MLERIKQLYRLWKLSKKNKQVMDDFMKLSSKEIMELPNTNESGIFISEGYQKEFKDFENEKKFGIKKLFGIE